MLTWDVDFSQSNVPIVNPRSPLSQDRDKVNVSLNGFALHPTPAREGGDAGSNENKLVFRSLSTGLGKRREIIGERHGGNV